MPKTKLNPFTGKFDFVGNFLGVLSSEPSGVNGDTYLNTGDNKLYMYYSGLWQELHTLTAATPTTGNPIGLLLALTYS